MPSTRTDTPFDLLRTYREHMIVEVSPNDQMVLSQEALDTETLPENDWANQYFWITEEALRAIVKAMVMGEKTTFKRILDLPCGHGRVLRGLRAAFPDAAITACDIDRDGVDFCARTFGARPVYGDVDPERIDLGEDAFDLIYVGSLLTHLDADRFRSFVAMLSRHLARNGLLVFTTHGRWCIAFHHNVMPFIAPEPWRAIEDAFRKDGFGYHDYAESPGYGVSLTSVGWVQSVIDGDPSLTTVLIHEKGLGNYQDLFVCKKWPIDNIYGPMHPKVRPAIYRGVTEMEGPPPVDRGPRLVNGLAPELQAPAAAVASVAEAAMLPDVGVLIVEDAPRKRSWAQRAATRLLGRRALDW